MIKNHLLISTIWTLHPDKPASGSWQKCFPLTHIVSFLLLNLKFFEAHSPLVPHVTASLALQPQRLFLGCFCKLALKRIFLSPVPMLLPFVCTFASRHRSSLSSLVDRDCVGPLNLALWTVRGDFFGRLHAAFTWLIRYRTNCLNI